MGGVGRWLIITGLMLVLVGIGLLVAERIPWLGRLPGDVEIRRDNSRFYAPLGTCLVISLVASLLLSLLWRR